MFQISDQRAGRQIISETEEKVRAVTKFCPGSFQLERPSFPPKIHIYELYNIVSELGNGFANIEKLVNIHAYM